MDVVFVLEKKQTDMDGNQLDNSLSYGADFSILAYNTFGLLPDHWMGFSK